MIELIFIPIKSSSKRDIGAGELLVADDGATDIDVAGDKKSKHRERDTECVVCPVSTRICHRH